MLAVLLQVALLASGLEEPPPRYVMLLPTVTNPPTAMADIRLAENGQTFPVAAGTQVSARVKGDLVVPLSDPGRTQIRIEIVLPLLAKNGRTILLPAGTQLVARVHLLRGQFSFVGFLFLILPDGRSVAMPEDAFRLGPGSLLPLQDGAPALLTVWRPLRVEAFGPVK
ncbi:MAG: hypothetical protein HXX12_11470 [Geothrix sp.]|uniref:hypothetical protein n=1 Tax=Geothrix sp. TaxID=1962974 RepID=UPI0017DC6355|nr:hypothetical protein [Geothrix sp.]NWJ41577.1 hypothetical protein [Geothrix sp.]WIL20440.1 MAG: hypothetical protein QOZ81_003010 [Geothrix sp.]